MRRTKRKPTPMFDRYKGQHPPDELLYYLGVRLGPTGKITQHHAGRFEDAASVDHIFSGQNRRPDLWANFIACNQHGHRGKHDGTRGERNRFITLALMAKWKKHYCDALWMPELRVYDDWNYTELREACGHLILPVVESVSFDDDFLETSRRQLQDVLTEIEGARPRC